MVKIGVGACVAAATAGAILHWVWSGDLSRLGPVAAAWWGG